MFGRHSFSGGGSRPSCLSRPSCTRREIVTKCGAGLAAIIAAGKAPAAFIRSALAARNAMMAGKRLPYDAEVEYLESTGTQWIDAGINFVSSTDAIELSFELLTSTVRYKWVFGAYDTKRLAIGAGDGTNRRTCAYNSTTNYLQDSLYIASPHTYTANIDGARIDDNQQQSFADFSTSANVFLFTIPLHDPPTNQCSNARIWYYKHWRNNVLVRDFIPVRFTNEFGVSEGAMYDRVSGELFRNQGTGAFVIGPDI